MELRRTGPESLVLAGTNGAGKSSIAGEALRQSGGQYFNPDEATQRFRDRYPALSLGQANARAWRMGRRLLTVAIDRRLSFAFETTLGGQTMTGLLLNAANAGHSVRVWYVGLESPELHIDRVRARVERGGHDIPESRIRHRYDASRENLIRLLPYLTELKLFDNSRPGDPAAGAEPDLLLILHVKRGRILDGCSMERVPEWAKPMILKALAGSGHEPGK